MANLVREDAVKDMVLENWAAQILINARLDSHSSPRETASAIFRYVQQFTYIHDPAGAFDAVQSARVTINRGYGDCDDLSVLLATLLAMVGFKPRFVLARYKRDAPGFEHIYIDLDLNGERLVLDPSTRANGPGWEAGNAIERVRYPIFNGKPIGIGQLVETCCNVFRGGCQDACGGTLPEPESTAGNDVRVVALAAPGLSFPVVLIILGGCAVAMKLAAKL